VPYISLIIPVPITDCAKAGKLPASPASEYNKT